MNAHIIYMLLANDIPKPIMRSMFQSKNIEHAKFKTLYKYHVFA